MSDDELAQVLIAVYYPGISRNSVSFEYLSGLEPVCKSNQERNYYIKIIVIIINNNRERGLSSSK